MAVTTTMPIVRNAPLVRVTDLDPERMLIWVGTVTADVSGGTLGGICDVPSGFACGFASVAAQIGSASTSNVVYLITEDAENILFHGVETFSVNSIARASSWNPPQILFHRDAIRMTAFADNVDGDDMTVQCIAWLWSQSTARNLPQKFFWPGTLG